MELHLVVVRPSSGSSRADIVTDVARIPTILSGEHAYYVVCVAMAAVTGA